MAAPTQIIRNFNNFKGLDLRSSELTRPTEFSTLFENCQISKSTSIEKMVGFKGRADTGSSSAGIATYARVNKTNGQINQELIGISDRLAVKTDGTFTITYTGALAAVIFEVRLDPTTQTFKAKIFEGEVTVLDVDLGIALSEVTPVTLADLKTAIDALADYAATITGTAAAPTLPAALLDNINTGLITVATPFDTTFFEWVDANITVASPLPGNISKAADSDFENSATINIHGNLYVANGYDDLHKYDGQTFYRAGLPKATPAPTAVTVGVGGGNGINDDRQHSYTFLQIDNQGNVIEGEISDQNAIVSYSGSQDADVTVTNLIAGSGFNTNCAIVAGVQVAVNTITVDDGAGGAHTMQPGDTAYFFDGVTGGFITRNVVSIVAGVSITIAGAAVDVLDNAVISNNLRISLYGTTASGTDRFLIDEFPNDSFNATQVIRDDVTAAEILNNAQFAEPLIVPSLPRKTRYITEFQDTLVLAGDNANVNAIYFADFGNSREGFDVFQRSILAESGKGDRITGIGTNNEILLTGKERSLFVTSGDISTFRIRTDQLTSGDIGVQSHHTIREVLGALAFLAEDNVYVVKSGQLPIPIGDPILPVIIGDIENVGSNFILKRAQAVNDVNNQKYYLFLPTEQVAFGEITADEDSRILSYDYFKGSWSRRNQVNAMSGFAKINKEVWFAERRNSVPTTSVENFAYLFGKGDEDSDYNDHQNSIPWVFGTDWEYAEDAVIFKRLLRMRPLAVVEIIPNSVATLEMDCEIDWFEGVVGSAKTVTIGLTGTGWGFGSWGTFPWGDPKSIDRDPLVFKMKRTKLKSWRFIFRNSEFFENVRLSGYEQQLALPYRASGGFKE